VANYDWERMSRVGRRKHRTLRKIKRLRLDGVARTEAPREIELRRKYRTLERRYNRLVRQGRRRAPDTGPSGGGDSRTTV
jgi:hypothetical protein